MQRNGGTPYARYRARSQLQRRPIMAEKKPVKGQRTSKGEPAAEKDVKNRKGNFTGKGEAPRKG